MNTSIVLLGVPSNLGSGVIGPVRGPDALRQHGFIQLLKKMGFSVEDLGNVPCKDQKELQITNPHLRFIDEILKTAKETATRVQNSIQKKQQVIVLGGDHSLSLGSISGASAAVNGDIGVLYIDAHPDFNTDKTTLDGNVHGIHMAALAGFGHESMVNFYKEGVKVKPENVLFIGTKDIDTHEQKLIDEQYIEMYDISSVELYGLLPLTKKIEELQKRVKHIWVSLDLDVLDQMFAPGVWSPTVGGMTYRELWVLSYFIGTHCNILGMDIVEYDPTKDIDEKTADIAVEMVARILGKNCNLKYDNYMQKQSSKL